MPSHPSHSILLDRVAIGIENVGSVMYRAGAL